MCVNFFNKSYKFLKILNFWFLILGWVFNVLLLSYKSLVGSWVIWVGLVDRNVKRLYFCSSVEKNELKLMFLDEIDFWKICYSMLYLFLYEVMFY